MIQFKSYSATSGGAAQTVQASNVVAIKFELVSSSVVTITHGNSAPFTISKDWEFTLPQPGPVNFTFAAATANAQCHLVQQP